jgi:hypothetical protein
MAKEDILHFYAVKNSEDLSEFRILLSVSTVSEFMEMMAG